jgi:integrase
LPSRAQIAKVEHHPALPYVELPAFMAALRARQGFAARALEFTILTTARTQESIGARWGEIENATWTVPADRMKAGKEHRVPLSAPALALLNALPRESDFIFPGPHKGTALGDRAMGRLLKRMGGTAITIHGFRSTFRDWAAERTSYPNHVIEQALAHAIGNAVEAAYRRGDLFDKRRQLMEAWARYCASPAHAPAVVPIRGTVS